MLLSVDEKASRIAFDAPNRYREVTRRNNLANGPLIILVPLAAPEYIGVDRETSGR